MVRPVPGTHPRHNRHQAFSHYFSHYFARYLMEGKKVWWVAWDGWLWRSPASHGAAAVFTSEFRATDYRANAGVTSLVTFEQLETG